MATPALTPDPLPVFWDDVEALRTALRRNAAVNVNAKVLRDQTRELVQSWFRVVRPYLLHLGLPEERIGSLDTSMQRLLKLSGAPHAKSSYIAEVDAIRITARPELDLDVEQHRGKVVLQAATHLQVTTTEARILDTLERIGLPEVARSYHQVLIDLSEARRLSYRGTATELREVVREVLDHLAPDDAVTSAPGFKLQADTTGPTMAQKARFILKARGLGESARRAPEEAVALFEEQIASLVRATYRKGAASTHVPTTLEQARNLKGFADAVLAELLQVHRE